MFSRKHVYLDYASATPVRKVARRAFVEALDAFGNPSSFHAEGRAALALLEDARKKIARLTETKPDDVIFTSGATEANNLAIRGLARSTVHMLYLPSAHASIVETMKEVQKTGVITEALVITDGRIDIDALKKQLRPETVLVAVEAVCGETGTIWNTREVKQVLPASVYLHVDASQAATTQKITRSHFEADLLVLDAQKVGGVRGTGVLIAPRTIPLAPVSTGGGQERTIRPGTENVAGAAAFAAALQEATASRERFSAHSDTLREKAIQALSACSETYINEGAKQAPHILNISFLGRDTDYLVALIDAAGISLSTRSACETDSEEGSRAVFALTNDPKRAQSTLRISFNEETTAGDIDRFMALLMKEIAFIDKGHT